MTNLLLPEDSPITGGATIVEDDGQLRVAGMLTRAEFNEIERVRNSKWFLVRNDGGQMGERAPCLRGKSDFDPGHYHAFFTAMCVERPFRGIERGLEVWLRASSDNLKKSALISGMTRGLEDYAKNHPQTASILKPADPDSVAWYTMLAGTHIPITEKEARRYAQRIKDRRPPSLPPELLSLLRPTTFEYRV